MPVTGVQTCALPICRGWVQKASSLPTSRYYELDGSSLHSFFPASDHFADYSLRVLDFIANFARFYELDPHAVLTELQGGPLAEPVRTSVPA